MECDSIDLIILRPEGQNPGAIDLIFTSRLEGQISGLLISVIHL